MGRAITHLDQQVKLRILLGKHTDPPQARDGLLGPGGADLFGGQLEMVAEVQHHVRIAYIRDVEGVLGYQNCLSELLDRDTGVECELVVL
ncbi:hypothetical protein [Streptomyces microflavus]|uniref:hypothetical protein n=1 Tax=Streptomyces microflavus TaxID=1919 RepID=UPI003698EEB6